jgi:hypothetical protein
VLVVCPDRALHAVSVLETANDEWDEIPARNAAVPLISWQFTASTNAFEIHVYSGQARTLSLPTRCVNTFAPLQLGSLIPLFQHERTLVDLSRTRNFGM